MLAASVLGARSQITVLYRKVKARFISPDAPLPYAQRRLADLPAGGETISVECALNSRCSSDGDGHPEIFHWGQLDTSSRVAPEHIRRVVTLSAGCIPEDAGNGIQIDDDVLTYVVEANASEDVQRTRMIYSGMQQQAVGLTCAALGIGITFQAQGPDGYQLPSGRLEAVKMQLRAMRASYGSQFWTSSAPAAELPWMKGNLPDPKRHGTLSLADALRRLRLESDGRAVTISDVSQLLWAARGRTPHLHNSKPWGLTIPTWQGLQNISSVSLATTSNFFEYVNWKNGRPTHYIEKATGASAACPWLASRFAPWNCFIILSTRELYARALWEAGYELLNVIAQAHVLGLTYRAIILAEPDLTALLSAIHAYGKSGTSRDSDKAVPCVVIALKAADDHILAD